MLPPLLGLGIGVPSDPKDAAKMLWCVIAVFFGLPMLAMILELAFNCGKACHP